VSTVALVGASALIGAACGGGDDSATTTTNPPVITQPPTVAPVVTEPPATQPPVVTSTTVELITEGASVVVANASGIDGAAGRLTDRLAGVGFTTGPATNSSDTVSNLAVTQIYYVPGDAAALAVAESVKAALGGGAIELLELTLPAPTASGDIGDAGVLVVMGNDVADKSLDVLQGLVPSSDTTPDGSTEPTTETTTS
jgi:hypothetical protein